MFDRHPTTPPTPEEMLDSWLDALNEPGRTGLPTPPAEIERIADIARRYRNAFGTTPTTTVARAAISERNGSMNHVLPLTTPHADAWRTVRPARHRHARRGAGWITWLSNGLATTMVIGLLLALSGAMIVQQTGLPGGADDPTPLGGIAASPEASPSDRALSCASPGYRPVVEGDVNEDTLAMIGETQAPLNLDGAHVLIPTAGGDVVALSNTWTPLGGPMWSNVGMSTIRNIETGEEWTFPLQTIDYSPGIYEKPYLLVPANGNATDWRIIDTITGEERLISDIRGKQFPDRTRISQLGIDYDQPQQPVETSVWLFSPDFVNPLEEEESATPIDQNTLVLPGDLDDAAFLEETVDARYFGETAYSPATNQLAFATGTGVARTIVVVNPETGETLAIRDDAFTGEALPLMFSEDGSTLIVDQPGTIFSVALAEDSSVDTVLETDEPFEPIAHNISSMHVLVEYPDRHVAIVDALSGEVTDFPEVTAPEPEYQSSSDRRFSFETPIHELFDHETGQIQFVNLEQATVSAPTAVLNYPEDSIDAAFQPVFQYVVRYPGTTWSDGYAFMDDTTTVRIVPTGPDAQQRSMAAPAGFALEEREVAQLFVNPAETCIVLHVATAVTYDYSSGSDASPSGSERIATWIAPLEPGATWTQLDVQLTAWFWTMEPAVETLPAPELATPTD